MKIVHMSDSHLGFQRFNRVDKDGRNLIEGMIYSNFNQTIDRIIELKPDAVIHAGDVFDRDRPWVMPLYVFKKGVEKLINNGIQVVIISGNHDAPKSYAFKSPFFMYEDLKDTYIAHDYKYGRFEVGDHIFHCIPYCLSQQDYQAKFSEISLSGRDVLVMHGMVSSLWGERNYNVGDYQINDIFLKKDFDYIALGHYHAQKRINENTWYCGSVECFDFKECHQDKGILLVNLENGNVEPIGVPQSRHWVDCPQIDCLGFTSEEIMSAVYDCIDQNEIKDKIVRINLMNVNSTALKNIDHAKMNELKKMAFFLHPHVQLESEEHGNEKQMDRFNLVDEFSEFLTQELNKNANNKAKNDELISYGVEIMKDVIQRRNTEGPNELD